MKDDSELLLHHRIDKKLKVFTTVRLKPVIKDSKILTYKTIISEISTRRI